ANLRERSGLRQGAACEPRASAGSGGFCRGAVALRAGSSADVSLPVAAEPAAEGREVEARAPRIEQNSCRGSHEHARHDAWRIAVFAQDAPDARAVASADGCEVDRLARM